MSSDLPPSRPAISPPPAAARPLVSRRSRGHERLSLAPLPTISGVLIPPARARPRRLLRPSPLALASARISEVDEEEANGTDDEEVRQSADEVADLPRFLNTNVQSSRPLKPRPSSVPHPPRVRRNLSVTESPTRRPQRLPLSLPLSPADDEGFPRRRRPTSVCPSSLADRESWYTNNAYASTPQFTRLGLRGSSVVLPESAKAYTARKKKEEQKTRQANVADPPVIVAPTSPSEKLSVNASATSSRSTSPSSTPTLSTRPPREHPPSPSRNKPLPLSHSQPSSSRKVLSFLSAPLSRLGAGGSTSAPLSSGRRRASSPSTSVSDSSSSITIVTPTSPSSASTHSAADSESLSAVSVKTTSVTSTAGSDADTGADTVGKVGRVACESSPASERVVLSKGGKKTRWVILNLVR